MADFAPEEILRVLAEHRVECILIGGTAAYLHGSPLLTEDIDIVPSGSEDNLSRLSAALTALQAKIRAEGAPPLAFAHDARSLGEQQMLNLTTMYGDLDITHAPSGTAGYADLQRDAVTVVIAGAEIQLASLADIVRSKEAAGRDKDRRALPVLRELLARQLRGS